LFKRLEISTSLQTDMIEITSLVEKTVKDSKVENGLCYVFIPHTTAGVAINENADPAVKRDFLVELNKIVQNREYFTHAEGNSAAHIKASIIGQSQTVFIEEGKLALGTWQGIFFCEFDGPRSRNIWVKIQKGEDKIK
jgi:secondary thiamine-phosphate synthase enzyme